MLSLRVKLIIATFLSLTLTASLAHLTISLWQSLDAHEVDEWLDQNQLGGYKVLFREHGEYSDSPTCNAGSVLYKCDFCTVRLECGERWVESGLKWGWKLYSD